MSISAATQSIQEYLPSGQKIINNLSPSISRMANNTKKVILPAIVLYGASSLSTASAGPVAYSVCTAACMALASPLLIPACIAACIPLGVAPTV